MGIFDAILLGVVQGITEFLPISSTGHLILARELFGLDGTDALAFDAVLHLATAGAVLVYFSREVSLLMNTALRKLGRLPVNERDLTLLYALLIATIPAVILGLLLESYMESYFRSPLLVAGVLVAGSILFMYGEWVYQNEPRRNELSLSKAFKIGLFQSLALIPGMSRSGASIAGGMILGLTRYEAARFAFLLAIPVILGAGGKKLIELIQSSDAVPWVAVSVGAVAAFLTGLAAVHFLLGFVRRNTLWPFIWYRVLLAGFVIFVVAFG